MRFIPSWGTKISHNVQVKKLGQTKNIRILWFHKTSFIVFIKKIEVTVIYIYIYMNIYIFLYINLMTMSKRKR